MIGQTVSHYEIESCLGQGGSGTVYAGRDLRLDRRVAIKVLADSLRNDELAWARLLREARLASQLNHPHIAAIYDLGEEEGRAFIVMECVEGLRLDDLIPPGGMATEQLERYALQITDALAYAHDRGVIHGDLKGSNILITSDGDIKLLDFGLGHRIGGNGIVESVGSGVPVAENGATAGTLPYLAPELLHGSPSGLQSDVWALGVLFYHMATGELPFRGATSFELCLEIMVGTPAKLAQLPEPWQSTLSLCLQKDPARRPSQVRELVTAAGAPAAKTEPAPSAPLPVQSTQELPSASPSKQPAAALTSGEPLAAAPAPPPRRLRWVTAASGGLLLLTLLGLYVHRQRVAPPPPAAAASQTPAAKSSRAENPSARVWVNTNSGTYHCEGTRWYGKTHDGEYLTQQEAREKGYRPAGGHACL